MSVVCSSKRQWPMAVIWRQTLFCQMWWMLWFCFTGELWCLVSQMSAGALVAFMLYQQSLASAFQVSIPLLFQLLKSLHCVKTWLSSSLGSSDVQAIRRGNYTARILMNWTACKRTWVVTRCFLDWQLQTTITYTLNSHYSTVLCKMRHWSSAKRMLQVLNCLL